MNYHWEKGFFSRFFKINTYDIEAGRITYDSMLSSKATAEIDSKSYRLNTDGIIDQKISIKSSDGENFLMFVESMKTRAKLNDKWLWESNLNNSTWSWKDEDGNLLITSKSKGFFGTSGVITVHDTPGVIDHRMLVLAGLYSHNFFEEILAVILIMFMVLFVF